MTLKPTESEREGKANQTTSRQRHSNGTSRRSSLQHNLQNARDTPSHTKEMLSCSIPGKKSQKDKPKIVVIGDSFARGIAGELVHNLGSTFEVIGHVKPGSGIKMITDSANQDVSTLTKKDVVVVWGAANDIAKNEAKNALTHITNFVELRKHTNVLLVWVPTRFDLSPTSCVNREVNSYNRKLYKRMKQFVHVRLIDSKLQREYFTKHGMHMKLAGKEIIAHRIAELIRETLPKKKTSTIPLLWKLDIDKRSAPTRKCDTGSSIDGSAVNTQMDQSLSTECNNENLIVPDEIRNV